MKLLLSLSYLKTTFLVFLFLLISSSSVFAAEPLTICPEGSTLPTCKAANLDIGGAVGTVIQFVFVIAVILALGFLVYGGIRWITSGGDKDGVAAARSTIVAALIGLILVFLAYVVLNLVLIFLTGAGIGGLKIPSLDDLAAA